jgi:hypothetical protein
MIITDAPHRKLAALVALVVVTGPATTRLFYASPAQARKKCVRNCSVG